MDFEIDKTGNLLYPVFLRLDKLRILVVGGGYVGMEKITSIYKSSPNAVVKLVAPEIRPEIEALASENICLTLFKKPFSEEDLHNVDLVIVATANAQLNQEVRKASKLKRILTNVADTPESCDFYLGSIVKKGDMKLAISTNGKSPTFAKRIREFLEDALPDGMQGVLDNLQVIREKLKGDFEDKVNKLNEITSLMKNQDIK